ncbi:hypothetical protein DFP72DRAFT_1094097 [Ephemerocybe angulata]|uniref:Uncharacterized protein n=1 Tax=Ephemerocybe angulata TaxID=980116 RepID=A0A8H6I7P9_9AGAR|nr:hypothetical protein DFP72DRAFT_1094097 [Tulosesus angulatus]
MLRWRATGGGWAKGSSPPHECPAFPDPQRNPRVFWGRHESSGGPVHCPAQLRPPAKLRYLMSGVPQPPRLYCGALENRAISCLQGEITKEQDRWNLELGLRRQPFVYGVGVKGRGNQEGSREPNCKITTNPNHEEKRHRLVSTSRVEAGFYSRALHRTYPASKQPSSLPSVKLYDFDSVIATMTYGQANVWGNDGAVLASAWTRDDLEGQRAIRSSSSRMIGWSHLGLGKTMWAVVGRRLTVELRRGDRRGRWRGV